MSTKDWKHERAHAGMKSVMSGERLMDDEEFKGEDEEYVAVLRMAVGVASTALHCKRLVRIRIWNEAHSRSSLLPAWKTAMLGETNIYLSC